MLASFDASPELDATDVAQPITPPLTSTPWYLQPRQQQGDRIYQTPSPPTPGATARDDQSVLIV